MKRYKREMWECREMVAECITLSESGGIVERAEESRATLNGLLETFLTSILQLNNSFFINIPIRDFNRLKWR